MKKQILLAALLITGISANAQLQNTSFENWTAAIDTVKHPDNWVINNGMGQFGVWRDDYSQDGQYALMLSRWYWYTYDDAVQRTTSTFKPLSFSGFYRYTGNLIQNGGSDYEDSAHVNIYATQWNSVLNRTDTLGRGELHLGGSEYWKGFSCPINYIMLGEPDSITVQLMPTKSYFDGTPMGMCTNAGENGTCSFFSVDNVALSPTLTGITDVPTKQFKVYPNPTTGDVFIASKDNLPVDYDIIDITGRIVASKTNHQPGEPIDMSEVACGSYSVHIRWDMQRAVYKLIKH